MKCRRSEALSRICTPGSIARGKGTLWRGAILAGSRRRLKSFAPWPPRYVAFVLVGMLGDTVMCLPVLEAAREAWPQARLCAVVTPRIREMLAGVGYVDEFLVGTGDPLSIRGRKQTRRTEERLSERRFDVSILLGGDQYAPLFYKAGVPIRVGPAACVYEPLLTHTYVVDDGQTWGPYERLGALRALGVETPHRVPRLDLDPQARVEFQRWRKKSLGDAYHSYIVIHPFGSASRQRWPLDRVPQLARQLYQLTGMRSLLVGGPEFRSVAASISGGRSLINTVGELSISQLFAAIEPIVQLCRNYGQWPIWHGRRSGQADYRAVSRAEAVTRQTLPTGQSYFWRRSFLREILPVESLPGGTMPPTQRHLDVRSVERDHWRRPNYRTKV